MTEDERRRALEQRRRELEDELRTISAELAGGSGGGVAAAAGGPDGAGAATAPQARRPVRAVVLDLLDDLGCLAYSRELAQLSAALLGRPVPSARFGALSADEEKTHLHGRPRSVYLAHAVTADRHEPIKRLWGRSDWPLHDRVVAPTSGRVRHLLITRRLCELAATRASRAYEPQMLLFLAADHARDLPGAQVRRGEFELGRWAELCDAELSDLLPRDEAARRAASARLARYSEHHQLFGLPDVAPGDDQPDLSPRAGALHALGET